MYSSLHSRFCTLVKLFHRQSYGISLFDIIYDEDADDDADGGGAENVILLFSNPTGD